MRKVVLSAVLAAIALPVATPALADPPPWAPAHGRRDHDRESVYYEQGRDMGPRRLGRDDHIWRGNDGRYYCRRSNGTTGLVVGAAIGGLIGNQVAGRGDRALGTLLGAAGGGVLGRAIDRGSVTCR